MKITDAAARAIARAWAAPQAAEPCRHCAGQGVVFTCPQWSLSRGACCPDGTHRAGCPGKTIACAKCGGSGLRP